MDRLQMLRVFARVAEMESFTRAAATLGLPLATVSSAVKSLETRVGSRLLQRTTRRVRMTHDGRMFYERSKDLLADADELETMFHDTGRRVEGRIRVDLPSRTASLHVLPELGAFLEEHPGIFVEFGSTDRAVDLVREGYDCVLRVGEVRTQDLVVKRLGTIELANCASPAYLERYGTPRKLADLTKHQLVHFTSTLGARVDGWEYQAEDEWKEIPMAGRIAVNNAEAYIAACLAGLGIVQIPSVGLRAHLKAGTLVEIMRKYRARPMPISLLYPHRRNVPRRVRLFMDWLEAIVRKEMLSAKVVVP